MGPAVLPKITAERFPICLHESPVTREAGGGRDAEAHAPSIAESPNPVSLSTRGAQLNACGLLSVRHYGPTRSSNIADGQAIRSITIL